MKKNKAVAIAGVALAAAMMSANPQQSVAYQGSETYLTKYGMSPKEYGIRYGNGSSRKGKTNFKKLSRQAKISKRIKSK